MNGQSCSREDAMLRRIELAELVLSAVALAACGAPTGGAAKHTGGAAAAGGGQSVTVKSTDLMRFAPASLTVRANSPVSLTPDNSGAALIHDFTIDNPGGQRVHIVAQPNSRGTGQFTPPAGTYQFYCSQPGHREAGMVGTLTVS
jgi:uncharacterized cupredoxin-like copper-binding protein